MIAEIILSLFYTALFVWIIRKWHFLRCWPLNKDVATCIFILKILAGIVLTLIYTYYYKVRVEADIFKFFDDSKYIYNALFINPLHYIQLVFGINADADYLQAYTTGTKFWAIQSPAYQEFMSTENFNFFNAHRFITRFNAIVRIFSFGHFTVHTIFMSFLSFLGLMAFFKTLYPFLSKKSFGLITAVFLMPAVVFWSSGVLKEGFIFLALGLLVYAFFNAVHNSLFNIKNLILLFAASLFLIFLKYYVFIVLIIPMISYFIAHRIKIKRVLYIYLIGYITVFFIMILLSSFTKTTGPLKILADKQSEQIKEAYGGTYCIYNNEIIKEIVYFPPDVELQKTVIDSSRHIFTIQEGIWAYNYKDGKLTGDSLLINAAALENAYFYEVYSRPRAGSCINIPTLKPELVSFIKALPVALFNAFFRPHLFDINNVFALIAATENLFVLMLFLSLIFFGKIDKEKLNLVLFMTFSVLSLFLIIGLTTPVLGNIVRYKAPFMPFLYVIYLLLLNDKKWKSFFMIIRNN